ncbi:MAG: CDP-alcohol phosphatidyltransferase family protein [Chloroflexi bacterium]|nr:CDP-alcohol phosphatidyltransferase family protein [Chloroflexota bacterium]
MAQLTSFNQAIRSGVSRLMGPVARLLLKGGLSPNDVTALGFLLNMAAAALLATDHLRWGGILILVAGAFDLLDGVMARSGAQSTSFGALLDSTLDRYSEVVLLFGLLILYVGNGAVTVLIYIAVVGSLMVSYVRARAEGLGLECSAGWLTRGPRVIVLALGLLFNQVVVALGVIALLANFTAAQRIMYLWQRLKLGP